MLRSQSFDKENLLEAVSCETTPEETDLYWACLSMLSGFGSEAFSLQALGSFGKDRRIVFVGGTEIHGAQKMGTVMVWRSGSQPS